jgi:AcrR family transcriptional regulator
MENAHSERKRFIIEAAQRVIAEQGFHKLTCRSVAREAHISPGTLYYYYKSKEEILYDILDSTTKELDNLTDKIEQGLIGHEDMPDQLSKLAINHVKNINRNKVFLHILHESLSQKDNHLNEKLSEKYNSWLEGFEKLYMYYFNISAPMSRALAILNDALMDGLVIKELLGFAPLEQPEVERLLELFFSRQFSEMSNLFHRGS